MNMKLTIWQLPEYGQNCGDDSGPKVELLSTATLTSLNITVSDIEVSRIHSLPGSALQEKNQPSSLYVYTCLVNKADFGSENSSTGNKWAVGQLAKADITASVSPEIKLMRVQFQNAQI